MAPSDIERAAQLREKLTAAIKDLGYSYVALDLEGYRMGAMNEVIDRKDAEAER